MAPFVRRGTMPAETGWAMSTSVGEVVQHGGPTPATGGLLDALPAYEAACLAVEAGRLGDPAQAANLLARWFEGVALLDAISRAKSDAEPRLIAAMTHLATAWLSPRYAGEPRTAMHGRIAQLRPVEQNELQVDLCEKNSQYGLTPDERGDLDRLLEFFHSLQTVLNSAIRSSSPPRTS